MKRLNAILAKQTGQKLKTIEKDTDRDNYMTAQEALEYGLIDAIIDKLKTFTIVDRMESPISEERG